MGDTAYVRFDPLFGADEAEAMLRLCERFGRYGTYAVETIADDFGEGIAQRHDAAVNFARTGGRFGRTEAGDRLIARTNYFREEYAYGATLAEGIEPFLHFAGFHAAACQVMKCTVVEPNIVYANILVPGQELAVHTDVPEFRGMSRRTDPQWLLVAMHHSGLFDAWRMPIATGVSWFGNPKGGEFVFYPDGASGSPVATPAVHNTAILLDTDSVFHGVDRVTEQKGDMPALRPGMALEFAGSDAWTLEDGDRTVARYTWDDLRFSISWKAYCYPDPEAHRIAREHTDDLTRERAVDLLVSDLQARGRIQDRPDDTLLGLTIIDEYIQFPAAATEAPG